MGTIPVVLRIKGPASHCHWAEEAGYRLSLRWAALLSQPLGGSTSSSLAVIDAMRPRGQPVLMEKNMHLLQLRHLRIFWENAEHWDGLRNQTICSRRDTVSLPHQDGNWCYAHGFFHVKILNSRLSPTSRSADSELHSHFHSLRFRFSQSDSELNTITSHLFFLFDFLRWILTEDIQGGNVFIFNNVSLMIFISKSLEISKLNTIIVF